MNPDTSQFEEKRCPKWRSLPQRYMDYNTAGTERSWDFTFRSRDFMDSNSYTVVVTGKIFLLLARMVRFIFAVNSSLNRKPAAKGHTNNSKWKITCCCAFLRKIICTSEKPTTLCPLYCHPVWFVAHSLHVLIFVDILSDPNRIAQGSAG